MISIAIKETTNTYIIDVPYYVSSITQLKNYILSFKTNYMYNNLKLVLLDNNNNGSYVSDNFKIENNDIYILSIVPIILD